MDKKPVPSDLNGKTDLNNNSHNSHQQIDNRDRLDRRSFLWRLGVGATTLVGLSSLKLPNMESEAEAEELGPLKYSRRRNLAKKIRLDAANLAKNRPTVKHPTNGEEELYHSKIANYSKGLPHNNLGEVDLSAYNALLGALSTGNPEDFEAIPIGGSRKLTNPQAGLAFDLEGPDSHHLSIRPSPTIAGSEAASELAELYWIALVRDVHFMDYDSDATIDAAATELSTFSDFRGPKSGGYVRPNTIFRGNTEGDLIGPYISQFLWLDIPMGALTIPQTMHTAMPGIDYLTAYNDWLNIQNGAAAMPYTYDPTPRYIRNLRDMAEWVHVDALYQAYHQACLILLGMGARLNPGNPYIQSRTQIGFGTFGGPHFLSLVPEVAARALKAAWFQKWFVHRRLRPEAFGGLVHHTRYGTASYPVNHEILDSIALDRIFSAHGLYLLPVAYPEGSPAHPSYCAGHATVAGACVTILKALFDESFVIPDPVVPDASGTSLLPYIGDNLTVGNELNKLAANVALGRNAAGIHYRSDYTESIKIGENVAIGILQEQKETYNEDVSFTFTSFDGTTITI
jgi:hypothetical protein